MLGYDRIDIAKGIYVNKTNKSKECDICHYWYFLDKDLKYEPYLCNGCHDLKQKAKNFNDVVIVSIEGSDYRIYFWYMSIDDAINTMKNSDLKKVDHYKFFSLYAKKSETTYYKRSRKNSIK